MASSNESSPICCPSGAIAHNGVCYCTNQHISQYPYACTVVCQNLDYSLSPSNGGCQCQIGYAGELCQQRPCYVYSVKEEKMKYYCNGKENSNVTITMNPTKVKDCSDIPNLVRNIENATGMYRSCPCFNGGTTVNGEKNDDYSTIPICTCPYPYFGDLCQLGPENDTDISNIDAMTANTFLGIIAFIILLITLISCCSRHRKRVARKKRNYDFHRHQISLAEYHSEPTLPKMMNEYLAMIPVFATTSKEGEGEGEQRTNGTGEGTSGEEKDNVKGIGASLKAFCEEWTPDIVKKTTTSFL